MRIPGSSGTTEVDMIGTLIFCIVIVLAGVFFFNPNDWRKF